MRKESVIKALKAAAFPLAIILFVFIVVVWLFAKGAKHSYNPNFTDAYDENAPLVSAESGVLEQNDRYSLSWDSETHNIILKDHQNDQIWSSIPYKYYEKGEYNGRARVMMLSPVFLDVYTKSTQMVTTLYAYNEVLMNGRTDSVRIENGLKVTYWFDSVKIGVPVTYTLTENGLRVEVLAKEIIEGDPDSLAWQVSVAPFMASSQNTETKDPNHFLFVPSGSGALMYTDVRGEGSRVFSAAVYGEDPIVDQRERLNNEMPVKLPVFGASEGEDVICGIIESGAGRAQICAESGNDRVGYANVYAKFKLRGYNRVTISYAGKGNVEHLRLTDVIFSDEPLVVLYSPLKRDGAQGTVSAYALMSKHFSAWLSRQYGMKSKTEEKLLSVKLLGGMQETRFALGIPRQKTVPLTTFDDALSITKDLAKLTDGSLDIQLLGFGDSGMDNGKIAGGFSLSPVFGNAKELIEYGQQQKIPLYFDYDIIRYNSRGNGFGKRQAAKNATSLVSVQKNYYPSIRSVNTEIPEYWLLGRSYLSSAATKLLSKTKNMTGISLASLGSISYSDYNEQKYPLRKGADTDAVSIINELRSKGKLVLVSSANDYAAASADRILDAPVTSDQSDSLDRDIPFYQMVFKGYVPISNTPLNAAARPESDFLKAIETGSGLCFSLYNIPRADVTRSDTLNRLLYSSLYGDNKEKMQKVVERAGAYFENVSGARISDHAYITDNVTRTVFDNGVTVYVNYGEKAFDTQAGTVQPLDFVYTKG